MRPLQTESAVSIAFAFGRTLQMEASERPHGLLSALYEELGARGVLRDLMDRMDPGYKTAIAAAVMLDKGAVRKGHRQRR